MRRLGKYAFEHSEHMAAVANLLLPRRIVVVRLLHRHLFPHPLKVHGYARVSLDELLKLLHRLTQRLRRVLVEMLYVLCQPVR